MRHIGILMGGIVLRLLELLLMNHLLVMLIIARYHLLAAHFHSSGSSIGQDCVSNLFVLQMGLKIKTGAARMHHALERQKVVRSNDL